MLILVICDSVDLKIGLKSYFGFEKFMSLIPFSSPYDAFKPLLISFSSYLSDSINAQW